MAAKTSAASCIGDKSSFAGRPSGLGWNHDCSDVTLSQRIYVNTMIQSLQTLELPYRQLTADDAEAEIPVAYHASTSIILPLQSVATGKIFSRRVRGGYGPVWAGYPGCERMEWALIQNNNFPYVDPDEWAEMAEVGPYNLWGNINIRKPKPEKENEEKPNTEKTDDKSSSSSL